MNQREDLITGTEGMADPGSETGSKAANALTAGALAAEGMVTRRGAKERDREDADQRAGAAASVQDARDALGSREQSGDPNRPPPKTADDPAAGPKAVAELEADRPVAGHSEGQGSGEQTRPGPQARPRASKESVREWLSAAHAPQTEETVEVMRRAENELRQSEPDLMRRFEQLQTQGRTSKDAMTSAMGTTRSASNHTGTQEPSSHPSVVMNHHRPTRTNSSGSGPTATKTRKRVKKAKAAMSGRSS